MRAFCIALGTVALLAPVAAADSCEDLVAEFAQARGLVATPPTVAAMGASPAAPPATIESRGLAEDRMATTEGVAAPLDVPRGEAAGMPTPETVGRGARETPPESVQEETPAEAGAADMGTTRTASDAVRIARGETLLLGAMSAARNDREQECLDLFRQAKEVL